MAFSFGFSGDDIDVDPSITTSETPSIPKPSTAPAFPVPGKPQLAPTAHSLSSLLATLPSKIAYDFLDVDLDDGTRLRLPRRELWDVRVQLMAEEEDGAEAAEGLGSHDVKTGVYEGGFKSWESSVDLVKTLATDRELFPQGQSQPLRVIELGCGTALPSLALFQWAAQANESFSKTPFSLVVSDYNPTVLQLVTLPNFVLSWALSNQHLEVLKDAFSIDGEVELGPEVLEAFQIFLKERAIDLRFLSGGWSPEFCQLIEEVTPAVTERRTLVLGAETIYSPFALQAFTETVFAVLEKEKALPNTKSAATAIVGAKRLYFGVGGSLDDFISVVQERGAQVTSLRDETEGVRRGVVRCTLG
ncbi:Mni1p [Sarocladium implicatum]|nr:Mni1p [Sarocladium implicatum]